MKEEGSLLNVLFLSAISLIVLVAIGVTAKVYWYDKDYPVLTEASCNPETETCFYRSCFEEEDYCPPNQLEYYRQFLVSAKNFTSCYDNSCLIRCTEGSIECEERVCGESEEDECVGPLGNEEAETEILQEEPESQPTE